MTPIIRILFPLLLPVGLMAQLELAGRVTDQHGEPLALANIVLYRLPDSLFIKGEVCAEDGTFRLSVPRAVTGYLEVSSLGYQPSAAEVSAGRQRYDFTLAPLPEVLEGVEVTAHKQVFEKKADRLIVNPGSNITNAGGTVLELVEKSPGVVVNRINQAISLNGKEGVLVMIDNNIRRLPADALLQLLQSISLNDVERVELIHNPPAEYEAAGGGGIIHVITKNNAVDGVSGNLGAGLNYYYRPGGQVNGSIQWNARRLNGFATYAYNYDHRDVSWTEQLVGPLTATSTTARSRIDRLEQTHLHNLTMGLSYQFDDKTSAQLLLSGNHRDFSQSGTNVGRYRVRDGAERVFSTELTEENVRTLATAFAGLQHQLSDAHRLSASVEYIYSYQDQPSRYLNHLDTGQDFAVVAEKITPLGTWIGQLDYQWQFGSGQRLRVGSKYNTSFFDNEVDIFNQVGSRSERDEILSNYSVLDEDIFAAYASVYGQAGDRWSWRAGLRMEQTQTVLTEAPDVLVVDRDYTNWFLNLSAEYELTARSRLAFSFNQRIIRPGFDALAPFVFYSNPITVFYGNQALFPSLTHTAGVQFSRGAIWVGLEYSWIEDQIAPFTPRYDTALDLLLRNSENVDRARMLGLQLNFPFRPTSWLEYNNTIMFTYQRIEIAADRVLTNPELSYQGNLVIDLPGQLSLGASGNWFYRQNWGVSYTRPYGHLDLGLTWHFPGSDATAAITFVDVLNTYRWDFRLLEDEQQDLEINTGYHFGMQGVRLTFAKPFGNTQVEKRDIDTGSAAEKRRIN